MKKIDLKINFGEVLNRIENIHEFKLLKPSEWADKLGVSRSVVSNIHGATKQKPSIEYIIAVSIATKISMEHLLWGHKNIDAAQDVVCEQLGDYGEKRASNEIAGLLKMTRDILESETEYGPSLAANIKSFHKSVLMERQLHNHEERLRLIEQGGAKVREIIRKSDPPDAKEELIKKRAT